MVFLHQGYDAEHKDINLLRLRNFTIGRKLTDQEVVGKQGLGRIAELISAMVPFVSVPLVSDPSEHAIYVNSIRPQSLDDAGDVSVALLCFWWEMRWRCTRRYQSQFTLRIPAGFGRGKGDDTRTAE